METNDIISLLNDLVFVLIGAGVFVVALKRKIQGEGSLPPPFTFTELGLTGAGLIVAAIGPNILVVATTPGLVEMPFLAKYILLPSIILWIGVTAYAKSKKYDRLYNRLVVGAWTGASAGAFLDIIRLTGFHLGQMPGNMPRMFGVMILDTMAVGPSPLSDFIGSLYHFWVAACFGLTLTLIGGKLQWWWGLIWGLIIEVGMMTTAPMVVAMDTGYFGSKFGPGLLITSLLAHIAFGIALGLLAEKYVGHKGNIFQLVQQLFSKK
jgi:hypothetical protein